MGQMIFITGGARSGKSNFAQQLAEKHKGKLLYIAPAEAEDDEMLRRVRLHQETRGERWHLLEEPLWLADKLLESAPGKGAILLDCVTLWISNLFFHFEEKQGPILAEVDRFFELAWQLDEPLYLVSNELGSGIVPDNPLARHFRDLAGIVNQRLAAAADDAWLVVAGLPLKLK
ncbi:bifunctional adenosylcobinamide kinase/adenosylcobinamide-phosphate guanylyltransferase [Geopsychrobacter electrodiphilus]|uniref:bifunctional adenosylcobinamide kinase/adenosylcobinamide-phosphate guanylyltransferase n=1 Tax=Geopsychrobacter electrodiphilus TaxID=225196 RepID=UPI000364FF53|nr:bifunctional adenosylcobinamide kinase/adenosylcobinamide-phosphate guanylyltransferase [Geopsychrobacter electrodiphilus]